MNVRPPSRRSLAALWLAFGVFALACMSMIVYALQLQETNAYAGFLELELDLPYIFTALISLIAIIVLMPTEFRKPSDFFRATYALFVLLPFALFHTVDQPFEFGKYATHFMVLVIPLLVVVLVSLVRTALIPMPMLSPRGVEYLLLTFCLAAAIVAVRNAPSSASFSFAEVYSRRHEARDIFVGGSLLAYLTTMSVNGVLPFLAFRAGYTARLWLFGASLAFALAFFYVSGIKAQFGYVFLAAGLGYALRREKLQRFYAVIFLAFLGLFGMFLLEFVMMEYSVTAEVAFRRIFPVPAHVMNSYFDLMFESPFQSWSAASGIANAHDGVTFLVGELYFGSDRYNVNTNAFINALAAGGIPAYLAALVLVCGVLGLLDAIHRSTASAATLYLGFAFSLLLVEQAATTAIVSSGMGILVVLMLFSGSKSSASPIFLRLKES